MLAGMSQVAGVMLNGAAGVPGAAGMGGAVAGAAKQAEGAPFSDLLEDAIGDVGRLESEAQKAVDGLMTGSGVDVHQAMIATQKASMAFDLSLAVRNKAVQAYQQLMGMQF
jgi:flagellar hook-basal body complex protein FliE